MTDKIKVWKCESCTTEPHGCLFIDLEGTDGTIDIEKEFPKCGLYVTNWQPATQYQITERKPEPAHVDNARDGITIQNQHLHIKGNPGNTTPPADHTTPPRKRVKIIWSEVNADNVEIAAALKDCDNMIIKPNHKTVGHPHNFVYISSIPKSWLEDIPAEPVSAEALLDKYLPKERMAGGEPREYNDDDVLCIIGYAEANNELRHTTDSKSWIKLGEIAEKFVSEDENTDDPDEIRRRYQETFWQVLIDLKIIE